MPRFRFLAATLLVAVLAIAGCSSDDGNEAEPTSSPTVPLSEAEPTSSPTAPLVVSSSPTAAPDRPERIVSLSPSATETLFALGAGDQVVAVDEFSYYPPEAPVTELSGWNPNVEAVLSYQPDLVVMANDANDLVAGLDAVGVTAYLSPAPTNLEGFYASIAEMGIAVGRPDEAAALVAHLRAEIGAALDAAPEVPVRVYHELDQTHFSVSSTGFIGTIYAAMGAINIADEADPGGSGYPQLTEEYIVEADPELIVITDQVGYTAADVAARPGWDEVTAVTNGNIVVVNTDIASRWGPRLPRLISTISEALQSVVEPVS